jgi:hypothetical protein
MMIVRRTFAAVQVKVKHNMYRYLNKWVEELLPLRVGSPMPSFLDLETVIVTIMHDFRPIQKVVGLSTSDVDSIVAEVTNYVDKLFVVIKWVEDMERAFHSQTLGDRYYRKELYF